MNQLKKIVVDLDGTLCEDTRGKNYVNPEPKLDVIELVNWYYDQGCDVTIFTARGMGRFDGDGNACDKNFRSLTQDWLEKHGVKHHRLMFGKPAADVYIDDKGMRPDEFIS